MMWRQAIPSLIVIAVIVVFLLACVILSYAADRKVDEDVDRELAGGRPTPCPLDECDEGTCCQAAVYTDACGGCCDCHGVCRKVYEWDDEHGGPLLSDAITRATERKPTQQEIDDAYRRWHDAS